MLCTLKGRNPDGTPSEGIDEVPIRPPKPKEELTLPSVVTLLKEANKREEALKENLKTWHRQYNTLYQEHMAYKMQDLCLECQSIRDTAWNTPGEFRSIYECDHCRHKGKTIAVLKRELVEKEEQIRYWQDCYETSLRERAEDTPLSTQCVDCLTKDKRIAEKEALVNYWISSYNTIVKDHLEWLANG